MPHSRATQNAIQGVIQATSQTVPPHGTLVRRGTTSSCRSYTALIVAAPSSALEETTYDYVLRIPLPGVLRHTLKWHLKDDTLTVSGDWQGGDASGAIFFGSVYRGVTLPPDAIPAGFSTGLEADSFVVHIPRHR